MRAATAPPPADRATPGHERGQPPPAGERGRGHVESWRHEVEVIERVESTSSSSTPARAAEQAAGVVPAAETLPPPTAAPPALAAPNPAAAALELPPVPAAAEGRPEVRVHIGRLEVRANLQPAPPPRRREAEPQAALELSLTDYLRGSRRA
jgi:hypothetical protein